LSKLFEGGKQAVREFLRASEWAFNKRLYSRQMVAPHKLFIADRARKVFLSGVGARVPGQFVGTCELFTAPLPFTGEWFFSYKQR